VTTRAWEWRQYFPVFESGENPNALAAIRAWTADLMPSLDRQDHTIAAGRLGQISVPIRMIFGEHDAYLSPHLARHVANLIKGAELHIVEKASH
jgi:pimeloyl-ACP methyl ester carboxylesterase